MNKLICILFICHPDKWQQELKRCKMRESNGKEAMLVKPRLLQVFIDDIKITTSDTII